MFLFTARPLSVFRVLISLEQIFLAVFFHEIFFHFFFPASFVLREPNLVTLARCQIAPRSVSVSCRMFDVVQTASRRSCETFSTFVFLRGPFLTMPGWFAEVFFSCDRRFFESELSFVWRVPGSFSWPPQRDFFTFLPVLVHRCTFCGTESRADVQHFSVLLILAAVYTSSFLNETYFACRCVFMAVRAALNTLLPASEFRNPNGHVLYTFPILPASPPSVHRNCRLANGSLHDLEET